MKHNKSFTIVLQILLALLIATSDGKAQTTAIDRANWMSAFGDSRRLNSLVIPGTHDTGAINLALDAGETQDWSVSEQLENGIRFLDVRIANSSNKPYDFEVRHGILLLGNFVTVILNPIKNFLNTHPKEIILMSVSEEGSPSLDKIKFMDKVVNASGSGIGRFITNANTATTLGEVRGGIVFFNRLGTPGGLQWGVPSAMNIQDNFNLDCKKIILGYCFKDSIDYQKKASQVIAHLNLAKADTGRNIFYINFASANWSGIYIGNNAVVANSAVRDYFSALNKQAENSVSFGSIIPMDYPNLPDNNVITSILKFNKIEAKE